MAIDVVPIADQWTDRYQLSVAADGCRLPTARYFRLPLINCIGRIDGRPIAIGCAPATRLAAEWPIDDRGHNLYINLVMFYHIHYD